MTLSSFCLQAVWAAVAPARWGGGQLSVAARLYALYTRQVARQLSDQVALHTSGTLTRHSYIGRIPIDDASDHESSTHQGPRLIHTSGKTRPTMTWYTYSHQGPANVRRTRSCTPGKPPSVTRTLALGSPRRRRILRLPLVHSAVGFPTEPYKLTRTSDSDLSSYPGPRRLIVGPVFATGGICIAL
jgi:hypothetical protein